MPIKVSRILSLIFLLCISLLASCEKAQPPRVFNGEEIAINPDFEIGVNMPMGWTSRNQALNDTTGWCQSDAQSGKRCLEILNEDGGDASWQGEQIKLGRTGTLIIRFSAWVKTSGMIPSGSFYAELASFNFTFQHSETWKMQSFVAIANSSDSLCLTPYIHLKNCRASAWIDNISIRLETVNIDELPSKILFDSNLPGLSFEGASSDKGSEGESIYISKGSRTLFSPAFIPVSKTCMYRLSGKFKSVVGDKNLLYFGLSPYSSDKRVMPILSVNFIVGTDTVLKEACEKEDKILQVENAQNWIGDKYCYVAFDTDTSLNDLPNYNMSAPGGVERVRKYAGHSTIYLTNACGKSYPKGTRVREHRSGGGYIYNGASNKVLRSEWETFCNSIGWSGSNSSVATNSNFCIYPGTSFVKILILTDYEKTGADTLFRNVVLEEIEMPKEGSRNPKE